MQEQVEDLLAFVGKPYYHRIVLTWQTTLAAVYLLVLDGQHSQLAACGLLLLLLVLILLTDFLLGLDQQHASDELLEAQKRRNLTYKAGARYQRVLGHRLLLRIMVLLLKAQVGDGFDRGFIQRSVSAVAGDLLMLF